ncbi:MAG TPA: hypothetical protein VF867_03105 [Arthrobacter sp.]
MSADFSRIEAAKSIATLRVSDAFKNEDGAFDLPSILVGVVVVGILTAGVLASIFGVIPFSQDKGAQQDLGAISTAEGVYKAQGNEAGGIAPGTKFGTGADLVTAKLISADAATKVNIASNAGFTHWAAATKSGSGIIYVSTDAAPTPVVSAELTTAAASTAALALIP